MLCWSHEISWVARWQISHRLTHIPWILRSSYPVCLTATMLLQKTSWSIKQFISHRINHSFESSNETLHETRSIGTKTLTNTPKRLSWLSQTPSSDSPTLQRANINATTRSCLEPPPIITTTHSSASSL